MRIPISEIPEEPELFEVEPGERFYVFSLKDASGGSARVRRDGDDLVFTPDRSASQQRLLAILRR